MMQSARQGSPALGGPGGRRQPKVGGTFKALSQMQRPVYRAGTNRLPPMRGAMTPPPTGGF